MIKTAWVACEYGSVWTDHYARCDMDTQVSIDQRLDSLCEKGNLSREPVSKPLGDGIFELRAKDERFLFYFSKDKTIIFVHALTKKRSDVPPKDIKLAKERRNDIGRLGIKVNALTN